MLARNLVRTEAGTRFIMISQAGWDMHSSIYKKRGLYKIAHELDTAFANLLEDLERTQGQDGRTLLEKTLIVCMGEFGRTPGELTVNTGRDHYPKCLYGNLRRRRHPRRTHPGSHRRVGRENQGSRLAQEKADLL